MYYFDKIYWHVENCKKFGTLPFAGLARCGFIAIELIESFVSGDIITEEDKNKFLNSIDTISSEMSNDIFKLSKLNFLKKYGHIRPNSYEITSLNYRDGYQKYFKNKKKNCLKKKHFLFPKIKNQKF